MARFLLDTDTCIGILRRQSPTSIARLAQSAPGDVEMSVITWGDLVRGAEMSRESGRAHDVLSQLARAVSVAPMPATAGTRYGRIRVELERRGTPIGNNDLWIAAHALAADVTIVTGNEREFTRIDGLRVENWLRP